MSIFLYANNNNPLAPSTLDLLTAPNMWVLNNNPQSETFIYRIFTRHEVTAKRVSGTDTIGGTGLFYLSDTEDTVFDSTKVGNVENGRYIIESSIFEPTSVFEIIEFRNNNTELVRRYDSKGKNVPSVVYSTWYAQFE